MVKKPKKFEKRWDKLTGEQQDLYVTVAWEAGYSEKAIADFLETTKGRIVVHRQRVLKLPTAGRDRPERALDLEVFEDLLDFHAIREIEKDPKVRAIAPVRREAAVRNPRFATDTERIARTGKKSRPKEAKKKTSRPPKTEHPPAEAEKPETVVPPTAPPEPTEAKAEDVIPETPPVEHVPRAEEKAPPTIPPEEVKPSEVKWPAMKETPEPSSLEDLRRRYRIGSKIPTGLCQWPLASGEYCCKEVVPSSKLCVEHSLGTSRRGA